MFKTDAEGRFRLRTIKPCSYPVPTDGPVGDMLHALHQNPYRPAHLHCMIQAEGYDRLITHVFVEGDPYLDSDAVFGVRSSCIGDYVRHEPGVAPDGTRLESHLHARLRVRAPAVGLRRWDGHFPAKLAGNGGRRSLRQRLGMDAPSASAARCRYRGRTRPARRSAHSRGILSGPWHAPGDRSGGGRAGRWTSAGVLGALFIEEVEGIPHVLIKIIGVCEAMALVAAVVIGFVGGNNEMRLAATSTQ